MTARRAHLDQGRESPVNVRMLKENRSLERGLIILETLAQHPALTLAELHRLTGLPKSTLRRLLATLVARRFIRRSLSDRKYRSVVTIPEISAAVVPPALALIADIGLSHALSLTRRIGWPSDIHVVDEHCMRIGESTRAISPYGIYQVPIDFQVSLFASAAGTVCLAQMPPATVRALFDKDRRTHGQGPDSPLDWAALDRHLAQVRTQGYGVRVPGFRSAIAINDRLSAIAVPLMRGGKACGAISLLWPKILMGHEAFAKLYLDELRQTAQLVAQDIDHNDQSGNRRRAK